MPNWGGGRFRGEVRFSLIVGGRDLFPHRPKGSYGGLLRRWRVPNALPRVDF